MKVNFNCAGASFAFIPAAAFTAAALLVGCVDTSTRTDGGVQTKDAAIDSTTPPPPDASGLCAVTDSGASDGGVSGPVEGDAGVTGNIRQDVNVALATNVVLPTLRDLENAIGALICATLRYSEAPTDAAARMAAQDAWRAAMTQVQRAELMRIGPSASAATALGGANLRDEIYAWPLINRCTIDQTIADKSYENTDTLAAKTVNARGLLAMEYLLFPQGSSNACSPTSPINAAGTWAAISGSDLSARRAKYAHNLALLAYAQASRLRNLWEPTGGNFLGAIQAPGTEPSPYANADQVLNAFSDAIFYVYSDTRDMKVAVPAGLGAVDPTPRPETVESAFAHVSLEHIRENIVAFRVMFTGGAPGSSNLGFDDLLVSLGPDGAALSADIIAKTDLAIAAADSVPGPLETAVVDHPAEVKALFDALKLISDLLKSQFVSLLGLQLPMSAAGDND